MRVLYFTERDSPHDQRFLTALAGSPYQVFALRQRLCIPDTPSGITEVHWPGQQPEWSNWAGWQHGKAQLQTILDDVQPDLVHAGPVQGPAFLTALAEFHPLVTMSWGSDLLLRAKRSPQFFKRSSDFSDNRPDFCMATLSLLIFLFSLCVPEPCDIRRSPFP